MTPSPENTDFKHEVLFKLLQYFKKENSVTDCVYCYEIDGFLIFHLIFSFCNRLAQDWSDLNMAIFTIGLSLSFLSIVLIQSRHLKKGAI